MNRTYYFGRDCLGNTPHAARRTPHAVTVEGTCICDIYAEPGVRFFNQQSRLRGEVLRGADGELHFYPGMQADTPIAGQS